MQLPSLLQNRRMAAAIVTVLAVVVYWNALDNRFAFDDIRIVEDNQSIQTLDALPEAVMSSYWPGRYGDLLSLWRPTTTALLGLEYVAGDGSPRVFHAVNLLGHAAVTLLTFLLLSELMSLAAAFIAAALFAVHPVHVEAVANIVGIAEIASAAFLLAACLIYVRGSPEKGWRPALAVAALYALAFGAKEGAVTLPGVIFLLDAARERLAFRDLGGYLRRVWRVYVAMAVVAIGLLLARYQILGVVAQPVSPLGADILAEIPRIWTLAEVWSNYARLWVFPMDLSADYSPSIIPMSTSWRAANLTGLLLALMVLGMSLIAWRRAVMKRGEDSARAAGFGVVWFIITMSPTSNVLFLSGVLLAERTFYLPSVGLAAATGWLFVRMAQRRRRAAWALLIVVLSLASWRTWTRTPSWRDNQTMFATLIREYPQSGRSQWVLGDILLGRGRTSEALFAYRAAVGLLGPNYLLYTATGQRLLDIGLYRPAEFLLKVAWKRQPGYSVAPGLLAVAYSETGYPVRAEHTAQAALAVDEDDPFRWQILSWALASQGELEEAARVKERGEEFSFVESWQTWTASAILDAAEGASERAIAAIDSASARAVTDEARSRVEEARIFILGADALPDTLPVAAETVNR
jgi:protein O-mannosyl-transferase